MIYLSFRKVVQTYYPTSNKKGFQRHKLTNALTALSNKECFKKRKDIKH